MIRGLMTLVLLVIAFTHAQAQWVPVRVSDSVVISEVAMVDSLVAYVGGRDVRDQTGWFRVFRTSDGGMIWTELRFDSVDDRPRAGPLLQITAPSRTAVFISDPYRIYSSFDSGQTWLEHPFNNLERLSKLIMLTPSTGYAMESSTRAIYRTDDSARSFPHHLKDTTFDNHVPLGTWGRPFWADLDHGFVLPTDRFDYLIRFVSTTNGGMDWKYTEVTRPSVFPGLTANGWRGSSSVWIYANYVHEGFGLDVMPLAYAFSSDFGNTWHLDSMFAGRIGTIAPINDHAFWVTLAHGDTLKGNYAVDIAAFTRDRKNWVYDSTSFAGYDITDMQFVSNSHGLAAANAFGSFNHEAYAFRYVGEPLHYKPHAERLVQFQVVPNPATTSLRILTEWNRSISNVEISNAVGVSFHCSMSQSNSDGCTLDTHELPPGLYFLKAWTNEGWHPACFVKLTN
jgi:hypothetical protein